MKPGCHEIKLHVLICIPTVLSILFACDNTESPPISPGSGNNADRDAPDDIVLDALDDAPSQDVAASDLAEEEEFPLCEGATPLLDTTISIHRLGGMILTREPVEIVSVDRMGMFLSHPEREIRVRFAHSMPERDDLDWPEVGATVLLTAYGCPSFTYGRLEDENLNLIWEGGSTVCTCENDGEGLPFQHLCQSQRYFEVDMSEPEESCVDGDTLAPDECEGIWTAWRANVRADVPVVLKGGESAEVTIQGRPFLAIAHLAGFYDCRCGSDCSQPVIALSLNPLSR